MSNSLFIEQHQNGLAFYINGDLQFDTADEAIYHEYLVIPTVSLAVKRFPQKDLRVLICGGGDGLALRDVLRHPEVSHVDLVDYDAEVVQLGRTVFKPYNAGSLESDRLTIYTKEAFKFITTCPDNYYHVVIGDFTYPTCPEDTNIYSLEWFQQVSRVLIPSGIFSTNGVSPSQRTTGFWCLYQTLLLAGLIVKPLQLEIPSFRSHGYGDWGFFLGSDLLIERNEIEEITYPDKLRCFTKNNLLASFIFTQKIAHIRHDVTIHTLNCPQLFYYLLNPAFELTERSGKVDFLDIQESGTARLSSQDLLQLESIAREWLEQLYQSSDDSAKNLDISKLMPVQHRYHTPKMTREWLGYLRHLLAEIDLELLIQSILKRSQEIPDRIVKDLKQLVAQIRSGKPLFNINPRTARLIIVLSVTLLMANLLTPDAVFAKGYYTNTDNPEIKGFNKVIGFYFTVSGLLWLGNIYKRCKNDE